MAIKRSTFYWWLETAGLWLALFVTVWRFYDDALLALAASTYFNGLLVWVELRFVKARIRE